MREFYGWKKSVRGPEPGEWCWQPGTRPVWHPASLHWLGPNPPADVWNEDRPTWSWLHTAEPSRTQIPSRDVRPFVLFYCPESGLGSGPDGDTGSDYFRYRNWEKTVHPTLERVPNNSLVDGSKNHISSCSTVCSSWTQKSLETPTEHRTLRKNGQRCNYWVSHHSQNSDFCRKQNAELDSLVAQLLNPPFLFHPLVFALRTVGSQLRVKFHGAEKRTSALGNAEQKSRNIM